MGPFISQAKKEQIFAKSNGQCFYCGNKAEEVEHMHPRFLGGNNDIENLVPSCKWCNKSKRGLPLEVWRVKRSIALGMVFTKEQREFWKSQGVSLPADQHLKFYFELRGLKP